SQSNRWRIAASRCLTLGAASSRVDASIQVATCTGWTEAIDGTPAAAHHDKIPLQLEHRPAACAGCGYWRRRIRGSASRARSPAAATSVGTARGEAIAGSRTLISVPDLAAAACRTCIDLRG